AVAEHREIVLGGGMTAFGGAAVPTGALGVVAAQAASRAEHCAELELRPGGALFGGVAVPQGRHFLLSRCCLGVRIISGRRLLCPEVAGLSRRPIALLRRFRFTTAVM